jgi:hypothetical protein
VHAEADAAADQRVDPPGVVDASAGRIQRRDEHRRGGRLIGDQHPAAEEQRGRHRERDHHTQLERAGAQRRDQQVADDDPEGHADHQLHRPAQPLPGRAAEHDDRRDRREERRAVADHLVRQEPGEPGRQTGLHDGPPVRPDPAQPLPYRHAPPHGHTLRRGAPHPDVARGGPANPLPAPLPRPPRVAFRVNEQPTFSVGLVATAAGALKAPFADDFLMR